MTKGTPEHFHERDDMQVQELIDFVRQNPNRKIKFETVRGKVCLLIESARADGFQLYDGAMLAGGSEEDAHVVSYELPRMLAETRQLGG